MKYLSLFSGIGGFEKGIQDVLPDAQCVGFSEIDRYAKSIYLNHFSGHKDYGNARDIISDEVPDFELLVAGFPCQAFSIAGNRKGFGDVRGTLFFEIARILRDKRPRYFLLENVAGLLSHDAGKTFQTILRVLSDLGYRVTWQVLNSGCFGVPQSRTRVFFVGCSGAERGRKILPIEEGMRLSYPANSEKQPSKQGICSILDSRYGSLRNAGETYIGTLRATYHKGYQSEGPLIGTLRNRKDGKGFCPVKGQLAPTLNARARQDGDMQPVSMIPEATKKGYAVAKEGDSVNLSFLSSKTRKGRVGHAIAQTLDTGMLQYTLQNAALRRLTPIECERLQGFPDNWTKYGKDGELISDTQRYKCLGNAVTTVVVRAEIKALATANVELMEAANARVG